MFKDYNKYLSASLKVYLFVLVLIFIMKLVGLDYFGIDVYNPIINNIDNICTQYKIDYLWYFITLYINLYLFLSITLKDNCNKIKLLTIMIMPLALILQYYKSKSSFTTIFVIIDFLYLLVVCILYKKLIKKEKITQSLVKRYILFSIFNIVVQCISLITRGVEYTNQNNLDYGFVKSVVLNLDYFIMLLIYYKILFMEGGIQKWEWEAFSSLQMKANLRNLQKRLQTKLHNFKIKTKQEKYAILIYLFLSLIWNTLSVIVVLFIAKLNHTFIECIFILSSFWLSKRVFGKAFHLSSMGQCFIVSNITYYVLNRITTPLGISIIVPIMLGVGLSYVTSKLTKKLYKPLYRGMPKDLFEETILKVEDRGSIKYNICYEYYIEKKLAINLSMKYHYSEANIRKILKITNKKIKELNK